MGIIFELTPVQKEAAKKWVEEHPCLARELMEKNRRLPALGERVRFVFIPTFLGTIAVVECACGAHHFLTDWSDL